MKLLKEGIPLGRRAYEYLSYELKSKLEKIGVKVNNIRIIPKGDGYNVEIDIDYFTTNRGKTQGTITLDQVGGLGVKVKIIGGKFSDLTFNDTDDVIDHTLHKIKQIQGNRNYPITFFENHNTMELTKKQLLEYIQGKKDIVVETTTAKEFLSKMNESMAGFALGPGFKKNDETVYEVDEKEIDDETVYEIDEKEVDKKEKKESGDFKYERQIKRGGSFGLGPGFKMNESISITKGNLLELVENVVTDLKGKTEYSGLSFVDRIVESYGLGKSHITNVKKIIRENVEDKGKLKLEQYINKCAKKLKENYASYSGMNVKSTVMIPKIKKAFNHLRKNSNLEESISKTAKYFKIPRKLVKEMYNLQKECKKGTLVKDNLNESFDQLYTKHQMIKEGNLKGMYEEFSDLMDYEDPKYNERSGDELDMDYDEDRYEKFKYSDSGESELRKQQKYGAVDPLDRYWGADDDFDQFADYDDDDDFGTIEEDLYDDMPNMPKRNPTQGSVDIYSDIDKDMPIYSDDDYGVPSPVEMPFDYEADLDIGYDQDEYSEIDTIYNEMKNMMKEGWGADEDEITVDGEDYDIQKKTEDEFVVRKEGWTGEVYNIKYIDGKLVGVNIDNLPMEVKQKVLDIARNIA